MLCAFRLNVVRRTLGGTVQEEMRPAGNTPPLLALAIIVLSFAPVGMTYAWLPRIERSTHGRDIRSTGSSASIILLAETKTSAQVPDNEARQPDPSWLTGFFCLSTEKRLASTPINYGYLTKYSDNEKS